jgi:hypothetical protein
MTTIFKIQWRIEMRTHQEWLDGEFSPDYILELDESTLTVEQLKPLKGMEIPVKIEKSEWQVMVLATDKLVITSASAKVDIFNDKITVNSTIIYCDFYLKGRKIYNAWLTVKRIQDHINNLTK